MDAAGIEYRYHGAIFDEKEKESILSHCSYGLNMMKPGVCVGMTMKSIDYWSHGLPVINNIPGDSERLCREEGLGINTDDAKDTISDILSENLTDENSRKHIREVYKDRFTEQAMHRILDQHLMQLG